MRTRNRRHTGRRGELVRLSHRRGRGRGSSRTRRGTSVEQKKGRRRLLVAVVVMGLVGALLAMRAVQLSVSGGAELALSLEPRANEGANPVAARGDILSADGRVLATSLDASRIVATPYLVEDRERVARQLAGLSGFPQAPELEKQLAPRDGRGELRGYSVLATDISPSVARKVEELSIEGVSVEEDGERIYPGGDMASQLLGYLSNEGTPYGGIEANYSDALAEGNDVELTIDAAVQQRLQRELEKARQKHEAKGATGVVMRVDDGSVVAMASAPGYDNNDFPKASAEAQRNRPVTDAYEPGSTFKAFTMAAALQEGAVDPGDRLTVPYSMPVADRTLHDSLYHETEVMTPAKIIAESSNVGTVKIARELGGRKLQDYIERFGFGEPTGVGLAGEAGGYVLPYGEWSGSSIGNIPIGQGISATPLQLAAGYAAIANDGVSVSPHIRQGEGEKGHRVISSRTSTIVSGMLEGVVEDGTGRRAAVPGYSVAGKTGTSQKIDPDTGTYGDSYVASFAGFAPADDPEYVTVIAVDEPQDTIWGERAAAPAFREVMGFALGYFNVTPDRPSTARENR